ncbi:MAG TPA: DsbA family protein [Acidimicrobiales bacterium]|nr:DsbA family protein [Acidimicrobiales bacterium]
MTDAAPTDDIDLYFYFDPACPWTWLTSRWLVDAAPRRGKAVTWRSLSLFVLNEGDIPEQYRLRVTAGRDAHRLFAALDEAGRNDLIGAVYAAIGARVHDGGEELTAAVVREAAAAAGAGAWLDAADDPAWDAAVELSTKRAVELAGPDVGSPVLAHGTPRVGMFGPIVSPGPRGEAGARLLDLALEAAEVAGFFELKRGRSGGPALPAPPPAP